MDKVDIQKLRGENKYPLVIQSDKYKSKMLMPKYLTLERFDALKEKKTSRGFSLWDCINPGLAHSELIVGVCAGDEESYAVFADLINQVIEDYHSPYKLKDGHVSDMNPEKFEAPNLDPDGKYIRSTRIRVARNLKGFGLAPSLGKEERIDLEKKIVSVLNVLTGELAGTYYPLSSMDEKKRKQLEDDHLLFKKESPFLEGAGCTKDWPRSRGIFYNKDKTLLVWVNEEDHLRIVSMEKGSNIVSVSRRLHKALNEINKHLEFQYTESHGYLSCCPSNLGTGMRASVHINIPKASERPDFQTICEEYHIQARGIDGEHTVSTGEDAGVFDISNRRRLGLSEVKCVQDMYNGVKKLLEIEQAQTAHY